MKKKFMNIRPQEVTEGDERSVQYKGSDGKMHGIAPAGNGGSTAQSQDVHLKDAFVIYRNNLALLGQSDQVVIYKMNDWIRTEVDVDTLMQALEQNASQPVLIQLESMEEGFNVLARVISLALSQNEEDESFSASVICLQWWAYEGNVVDIFNVVLEKNEQGSTIEFIPQAFAIGNDDSGNGQIASGTELGGNGKL